MDKLQKISLMILAYYVSNNLSRNSKNDDDQFLLEICDSFFESSSKFLEVFSKVFNSVDTPNFNNLLNELNNQQPSIFNNVPKESANTIRPSINTEVIDAAVGVGSAINAELVKQNRVNQELEAIQINEFNEMMTVFHDGDCSCDI